MIAAARRSEMTLTNQGCMLRHQLSISVNLHIIHPFLNRATVRVYFSLKNIHVSSQLSKGKVGRLILSPFNQNRSRLQVNMFLKERVNDSV